MLVTSFPVRMSSTITIKLLCRTAPEVIFGLKMINAECGYVCLPLCPFTILPFSSKTLFLGHKSLKHRKCRIRISLRHYAAVYGSFLNWQNNVFLYRLCGVGWGVVGKSQTKRTLTIDESLTHSHSLTHCHSLTVTHSLSLTASVVVDFVVRSFVPLISFVRLFVRSFVPSFLRSFVPSISFVRFLPSFLRFLRSFVPSFLRLRSFVPLTSLL